MSFVAIGFQSNGVKKTEIVIVRAAVLPTEPRGRFNFVKNDAVGKVLAVRAVHGKAPLPAGLYFHRVDSVGKTARPPPVTDMIRVRPYFPHQLARRIDSAAL